MPHEIEIYVHTDGHHDPKLVKIQDDATVEDLLKSIAPEGHHEFHLVIEDEEDAKEHHHRLCDCGIRHRQHVHCHRCRHVQVTVSFNGVDHDHQFTPAATIARVLEWALKKFKLTGQDAARKVLRITDRPNDTLPMEAHIGSYAKAPNCGVHLSLTDDKNVNG